MSVESDLYTLLTAAPAVTALAAQRIYPDALPEKTTYPALVFSVDRAPIYTISGHNCGADATAEIECWAKTRSDANALAAAVEAALAAAGHTPERRTPGMDPETALLAAVVSVDILEQPA